MFELRRLQVITRNANYQSVNGRNTTVYTPGITTMSLHSFDGMETIVDLYANANKGYKLKDGDKVYISKFSGIPRYKFAEFTKGTKITRVVKPDKANVFILGDDRHINYLFYLNERSTRHGSRCYDFIRMDINTFNNLNNAHLQGTGNVYIPYNKRDAFSTNTFCSQSIADSYPHERYLYDYDASRINFSLINEEINVLLEAKARGAILIDQKELLGDISENVGVTIDEELYKELGDMLSSTDANNVSMAMEIMANSNYATSEVNIVLLLNKYTHKINSSKSKNLVNFQSLLKYFDHYKWEKPMIQFLPTFFHNLEIKGLLTEELKEKYRVEVEDLYKAAYPSLRDMVNIKVTFREKEKGIDVDPLSTTNI